MLAFQIVLMY